MYVGANILTIFSTRLIQLVFVRKSAQTFIYKNYIMTFLLHRLHQLQISVMNLAASSTTAQQLVTNNK